MFANRSPYSSAGPIGRGKLLESMPPGLGVEGLGLAPTGFGRGLFGIGFSIMLVFGWLAFATYERPGFAWDELPSATFPSAEAPRSPGTDRGVAAFIPVDAPGRYYVVVMDEVDFQNRTGAAEQLVFDRPSQQIVWGSGTQPVASEASGEPLGVGVSAGSRSEKGGPLRAVAIPAAGAPTVVHRPTFERDVALFGLGLSMFVVGVTLHQRDVRVLKARARAIEHELEAARVAAG
jgi:hypothetical protein